jgi:hypothetical protein
MAELSTDIPARFPHENSRQYADRKTKYELLLDHYKDEDDCAALSMVYSNMVYLGGRYPAEVEQKLIMIPEIAKIIANNRDDSASRVQRIITESREAFSYKQ